MYNNTYAQVAHAQQLRITFGGIWWEETRCYNRHYKGCTCSVVEILEGFWWENKVFWRDFSLASEEQTSYQQACQLEPSCLYVLVLFNYDKQYIYGTNVQITRMLLREETKIVKMAHLFLSGNALSVYTNQTRHFVPNFLLQRIGTICLTIVELPSQKQQQPRPERHKGKGQHYIRILNHNLGHRIRYNIFMIQDRVIYIAISSIASVQLYS